MASPRKAGVKVAVNSLNCSKFSPKSMSGMLFMMLSSATLAHALSIVYRCETGVMKDGTHMKASIPD